MDWNMERNDGMENGMEQWTYTVAATLMSLIIRTIQSFKHPPFPEKMINYCIPSIQTPTFDEIIIPISEQLHLLELERGSTNIY